jgi:hypothetical protein
MVLSSTLLGLALDIGGEPDAVWRCANLAWTRLQRREAVIRAGRYAFDKNASCTASSSGRAYRCTI